MTTSTKSTAVPTDLLCTGLYVVELDRPWIETPFLFQGFRITCDEELNALRETCRHVYIDARRSERGSLQTLKSSAARYKAEREARRTDRTQTSRKPRIRTPTARAVEKCAGSLFADVVEPDRKRFRTLVQAARVSRHQATTSVTAAMHAARMGKALDLVSVRDSVERLAGLTVNDPSASIWLSRLKEKSDREARHAVNTCVLALTFGAYLGMKPKELRRLGMGALLHDIGKTRVPGRILDKPDRLTEQELDIVRRHPEAGYELLADHGNVDREVLDMVRLHHERWRGQGYPWGMMGETIPKHALIMGLVDSYDAMTSERPYRQAMTPEKALQTLYSEADRHFTVELVQDFIRCLGIFPAGSVVELDNGAHAVVVGSKPGSGLWPTILMVRNPDGDLYRKRLLLNLAAEAKRARDGKGRHIKRAVEPSSSGIDVARIVQQEFGLEEAEAA
jgi:HD-GYP domain-containing protein (c-di-GMP phosphodiesterase class II)